ncbi:Oidioi.mRNA.OKI2018_I69.YSR.g17129.t1.cds, partial [Oikopleura dioica]
MECLTPGSTSKSQPCDQVVNLWLKNKIKTAVALYGARLGPFRGACPTRSWVIKKAFQLMLEIPKETIDASWRKVNLEHPMIHEDFIFEVDDEEEEIEVGAQNGQVGDGAQMEEEAEVGAQNGEVGYGAQMEEVADEGYQNGQGGEVGQMIDEMVAEIDWEMVGAENEAYGGAQIEEIDDEMEENGGEMDI